jgi:hypothetical protein
VQFQMHRFNHLATLDASADIRLICNNHKEEVRRQSRALVDDILVEFEILRARRGMRVSIPYDHSVNYSVAVQKYCPSCYLMLSHFVSATLRLGCEIHKCQITAWNASVCGVTFSGFPVGMRSPRTSRSTRYS